jgi:hypothetical protein
LFRLIAVALLALAVPVQGMAAVAAGQCMAFGHHNTAGSQDGDHAHDGGEGHEQAAHTQQSDDGKNAHCGPCTACCASATITGPAGILILSSPSNVTYLFSQFPPLGFQPTGLDRPPLAL